MNSEVRTMAIRFDETLVYGLHRASQAVEAPLSRALSEIGLTARAAVLLMAIAESGDAKQVELVALTGVDRSTVGQMLRRLEEAGLVGRPRSELDTRARVVSLTAEGKRVERAAREIVESVEREMRERLGANHAALGRLLNKVAASSKPSA